MVDEIDVPRITPHSTLIQKALAISAILVAISVPVTTSYIAAKYAEQSAHRQGNVQMVELAVGILREEPKPTTESIRAWALDVLDQYSGVQIPKGAREALVKSEALPGQAVHVPNVVGLSLNAAERMLTGLGLRAVIDGPPDGMVIAQFPRPGEVVPGGSTVNLQLK